MKNEHRLILAGSFGKLKFLLASDNISTLFAILLQVFPKPPATMIEPLDTETKNAIFNQFSVLVSNMILIFSI